MLRDCDSVNARSDIVHCSSRRDSAVVAISRIIPLRRLVSPRRGYDELRRMDMRDEGWHPESQSLCLGECADLGRSRYRGVRGRYHTFGVRRIRLVEAQIVPACCLTRRCS
jgi:hypothetical protein